MSHEKGEHSPEYIDDHMEPTRTRDSPYKGRSVGNYIATRITTLKPPMDSLENPFTLLGLLNFKQWMFFLVAFCGWTWDAFDFFTVSLTVSDLAESFGKSKTAITWGITLVLMFRSVGAVLFGIAADRYGRKWPFIFNLVLFIVLELGTGFTYNYAEFLAVRALYGVAMGGLYGNCAATALEDCPERARGIISGMLQQGYAFGYLLATAFARALVDTTPHGWRPLFWFGAGVPVLIIIFRLFLGETDAFIERKRLRASGDSVGKTFVAEGKVALKRHWLLLLYMVLLMAGFNFMSHGSQDLYPTMLENQYEFGKNGVTVTQVVANLGAMCGGTTVGYLSQKLGRRFSIICISIVGGALLYPYSFTGSKAVIAAAFFEQFCVQGAWGVIPIHLMELSPGGYRTFVVGTSYQLGNLVSSASSTIESTIGERFPLPPIFEDGEKMGGSGNLVSSASSTIESTIGERFPLPPIFEDGEKISRYKYGKVICIFMGCVYAYVICLAFIGPEYKGRNLDAAHDSDLAEARGLRDTADGHSGSDEEKVEKV